MADSKEIVHLNFSDMNTRGILNPLVSFDCLIDTDFGLLVLIAQNFFDTEVFSEEFFRRNNNINDMKWAVYGRKEKNPLTLCMKDTTDADDYYNQFMEQYYDDILERSMITDLAKLIPELATNSGASFTILCRNESEIKLLDTLNILGEYKKILVKDVLEPDSFNQFFIKDFDDEGMLRYSNLIRDKHIYVARYNFNAIDDLNKFDDRFETYILLDNQRCNITKFDLYSRRKEEYSENDE